MTSNGDTKIDEVYGEDRPIMASELEVVLTETETMLQEMRDVINVHAEVLASHRWVLDRFVPKELLVDAFRQYYESRKKQIDIEAGMESPDAKEVN